MKANRRVVIVEDHIMVRQLLSHLITDDLNLTIVGEARTVADACSLCLREKPDMAIVDWMLPDGRGFEVVRKTAPVLTRTRWLFVSSNEQGHMVREAVQLGVQGFVLKRADLSVLRTAIARVLAGEKYYCADSARLLVEKLVDESQATGATLTSREREILRGYARGENPKAIAERLGIASKTINNHLTTIKDKLSLHEPAELVRYAIKHGYVELP